MNNAINEIKNTLEGTNSRIMEAEDRISEVEDRMVEINEQLCATGGKGNGTPHKYSCLENPMDGGAWQAAVHGVAKSRTRLSNFTFTFHFSALEKEMATHCSVLAWRIPGTGSLLGCHLWGRTELDMTEATQQQQQQQ